MRGYGHFLLIVPLVGLLAGCGAHHSSIFRTYEVQEGDGSKTDSVVIDAKQRAILATSTEGINLNDWSRDRVALVCAEPSPDALSAISSTFSGSLGGIFGPS